MDAQVFINNKGNGFRGSESNIESTHLRHSNLTLSRYDECMPFRSHHDSKTSIYGSRVKSAHLHKIYSGSNLDVKRHDSDGPSLSKKLSKRLSAIYPGPGSQTSIRPKSAGSRKLRSEISILHSMVSRQRQLMVVIGAISIATFVTGCAVTAVCFTNMYDAVVPGHVLGPIMLILGAGGAIYSTVNFQKFTAELEEKILRRDRLFTSFKEIEREVSEKESGKYYYDKMMTKPPSGDSCDSLYYKRKSSLCS